MWIEPVAVQQYKQPLHTLEQNKFETRLWHIIFGQGSAQRKCFDLEALANLSFSRGTGRPLDSEEMTYLCACCQRIESRWSRDHPCYTETVRGSKPERACKNCRFFRGTGGPLDNGGTGELPFRLVISSMLSTGWTGDQILF